MRFLQPMFLCFALGTTGCVDPITGDVAGPKHSPGSPLTVEWYAETTFTFEEAAGLKEAAISGEPTIVGPFTLTCAKESTDKTVLGFLKLDVEIDSKENGKMPLSYETEVSCSSEITLRYEPLDSDITYNLTVSHLKNKDGKQEVFRTGRASFSLVGNDNVTFTLNYDQE